MKRILLSLLLLVILGAGCIGGVYYLLHKPINKQLVFDIPSGDNLSSISTRLKRLDALPMHDAVFKVMALFSRDNGSIRAGQYQLLADMNALDLLALFRSGRVIQYKITFPEGWTFGQWQQVLSEAPHIKLVLEGLTRQQIAEYLDIANDPEGWFFPDTYHYSSGDTDLEILDLAYRQMQEVLDDVWSKGQQSAVIASSYETLVLASIIEKETADEADREKIASVFLNRLNKRMKLQSDPTVIYGLGDDFDGDLKRSHLKSDTAFNTYTRHGLPPTPICAPGRKSIEAAASISRHDYLYFVAKGDGLSYFSLTLEEHNQAVNKYQRNR